MQPTFPAFPVASGEIMPLTLDLSVIISPLGAKNGGQEGAQKRGGRKRGVRVKEGCAKDGRLRKVDARGDGDAGR